MCATASTAEGGMGKWFNAAQCKVGAKGEESSGGEVLAGKKSVAAKGAKAA